ncbi:MAG: hypothetical protein EXS03_00910 [Phycisphaerales bacterium]|nr:hypothetical protein [Phycisphaerales bacterium]
MVSRRSTSFRWSWYAAIAGVFLALVWPVILWGSDRTSEASDQNRHHLVVIRQAAACLSGEEGAPPLLSFLRDYPSATSPGYHLILAAIDLLGVHSVTGLRLLSSLCGLALIVALFRGLARSMDCWSAAACSLPLLCSSYFLSGSMWITTDVAGAWLMVTALLTMLTHGVPGRRHLFTGCQMAAAVLVRQPTLWLVGPMALVGAIDGMRLFGRMSSAGDGPAARRWSALDWISWGFAIGVPVATVAWLHSLWGGFLPPGFHKQHNMGANPANPAFFLGLVALWSSPFVAEFIRRGEFRVALLRRCVIIGAIVGLVAATVVATDHSRADGRWGGPLWSAVAAIGAVGHRSIALLLLAPLGGASLGMLLGRVWTHGGARQGLIMTTAIAAFLAASSANSQCFERYLDIALLSFIPIMVALGDTESSASARVPLRIAAVSLALVQFAMSCVMVYAPALIPVTTAP